MEINHVSSAQFSSVAFYFAFFLYTLKFIWEYLYLGSLTTDARTTPSHLPMGMHAHTIYHSALA